MPHPPEPSVLYTVDLAGTEGQNDNTETISFLGLVEDNEVNAEGGVPEQHLESLANPNFLKHAAGQALYGVAQLVPETLALTNTLKIIAASRPYLERILDNESVREVVGVRQSAVGVGAMVSTVLSAAKARLGDAAATEKKKGLTREKAAAAALAGLDVKGVGGVVVGDETASSEVEAWREVLEGGGDWWLKGGEGKEEEAEVQEPAAVVEEAEEQRSSALLPPSTLASPPPMPPPATPTMATPTPTPKKKKNELQEARGRARCRGPHHFHLNVVLRWRFRVLAHDIGFALRLRAQDEEGGASEADAFPLERHKAGVTVCGEWCPSSQQRGSDASLVMVWDNSYSLFREKTVAFYSTTATPNEPQTAPLPASPSPLPVSSPVPQQALPSALPPPLEHRAEETSPL